MGSLLPIGARYVLRQIAKPLLAAMAIGLVVLLSERLVRLLDLTLGKRNSFSMVFEMLAYLVPHYLGLALPAAFFLGLLFGFNRLSRQCEIEAFMASGIGLYQLTRPVLVMAVAFAALSVVIVGFIQPHGRYAYRSLVHAVKNVEIFYLAEAGVFMQAGNRTFILDKVSREDSRFERIFLFHDKGPEGSETITSTNGALIEVPGERRPVLRLEGGHRLAIEGWPDPDGKEPLPLYVVGQFSEVETPLGRLSDQLFRARGLDERELTLPELVARRDTPPAGATVHDMRAELHRRIISILTVLILPILAIPFSLGRRRGHRAYGFGIALIVLVAFHEIIEQGALAVRVRGASPYLTMWTPFLVLVGFSVWRYVRCCFNVASDSLEPLIERLGEAGSWVLAHLTSWRRQAGA